MLFSGSKNSFDIDHQPLTGQRERVSAAYEMNTFHTGIKLLPGEKVRGEAGGVRLVGAGWVTGGTDGSLVCTNFRLAFRPTDIRATQDSDHSRLLLSDNDVALTCIDKVVAASSTRCKVMRGGQRLKFHPREVTVHSKDFRILRFQFDPDSRAREIVSLVAQSFRPAAIHDLFAFHFLQETTLSPGDGQAGRGPAWHTRMFENTRDWQSELERTSAHGWRLSLANLRFEMAPSLAQCVVVPHPVSEADVKSAFAHFTDGRIPRWQWHHPRGGDLLRMSQFQSHSCPNREAVSTLEDLMYGTHQRLVIADLTDDLPTPTDIQTSLTKLRQLCVPESPASLKELDDKWLSALETTRWLEFVRLCLRKAGILSALFANHSLSIVLQESDDRDLSCVISSLLQVMLDPGCRTLAGFQALVQKEWVVGGHRFTDRLNPLRLSHKDESPVFLLFLDCVWQLVESDPTLFEFTGTYLTVLQDSSQLLLFGTFLFNSQRERERSQRVSPTEPPTVFAGFGGAVRASLKGSVKPERVVLKGGYFAREGAQRPLPSVWDWLLEAASERRPLLYSALYSPETPTQNGGRPRQVEPSSSRSAYVLTKGALTPWRTSSAARRPAKWSPSLESLEAGEPGPPDLTTDPRGLPLAPPSGPGLRLWDACFLRWLPGPRAPRPDLQRRLWSLAAEVEGLRRAVGRGGGGGI